MCTHEMFFPLLSTQNILPNVYSNYRYKSKDTNVRTEWKEKMKQLNGNENHTDDGDGGDVVDINSRLVQLDKP